MGGTYYILYIINHPINPSFLTRHPRFGLAPIGPLVRVLGQRLTIRLRLALFVEGDSVVTECWLWKSWDKSQHSKVPDVHWEVSRFFWWKRTGFVTFGHGGELGFDFGGGDAGHGDG